MKKIIFLAIISCSCLCFGGSLTNTTAEVQNAIRLVLCPGHLAAQLSETNAPIDTVCAQDVPTNILGVASLTVTDSQDFSFDGAATNFYYNVSGATNVPFNLVSTMSFKFNQPNSSIIIRATKNGSAIDGIYTNVETGVASKNNEVSITGHFLLAENDYIELSVESGTAGTFSATSFATQIKEEAQ